MLLLGETIFIFKSVYSERCRSLPFEERPWLPGFVDPISLYISGVGGHWLVSRHWPMPSGKVTAFSLSPFLLARLRSARSFMHTFSEDWHWLVSRPNEEIGTFIVLLDKNFTKNESLLKVSGRKMHSVANRRLVCYFLIVSFPLVFVVNFRSTVARHWLQSPVNIYQISISRRITRVLFAYP